MAGTWTRREWIGAASSAASGIILLGGTEVLAQRGGGSIIFTRARPARDFVGNIRGWATSNATTSYEEDTTSHVWRVMFMAFFARGPGAPAITLSWFHITGANRARNFIAGSNEDISLTDQSSRTLFYNTSLRRNPDTFQPQERYEAILSVGDASGSNILARGTIQLNGQLERRGPGVVDFTNPATPGAGSR